MLFWFKSTPRCEKKVSCEGAVEAEAWMWAAKVARLFTAIKLVSMLLYLSIRKNWCKGEWW